ncbi:hypothetical protein RJ639_041169 [Escallonia herrerae]|uniref:Non-haem dioxygenase N-terminal domain-containing protein n=1 Tax=Escallonia herrerae TaxID=1293975 RepID=A0AA89B2N3_9ASTE|nr:hypothetical protein RJ639_041169 [Escallonia herrerae]
MGEAQIPHLDFCVGALGLEQKGTEEWNDLSKRVREACETHGCFLVVYDKIPRHQREEMIVKLEALFDLPEETKKKYTDVCLYVDDILIFGTNMDEINETKEYLSSMFKMKDLGEGEFLSMVVLNTIHEVVHQIVGLLSCKHLPKWDQTTDDAFVVCTCMATL